MFGEQIKEKQKEIQKGKYTWKEKKDKANHGSKEKRKDAAKEKGKDYPKEKAKDILKEKGKDSSRETGRLSERSRDRDSLSSDDGMEVAFFFKKEKFSNAHTHSHLH